MGPMLGCHGTHPIPLQPWFIHSQWFVDQLAAIHGWTMVDGGTHLEEHAICSQSPKCIREIWLWGRSREELFLHCFFFGTCWPFWKGMGCNGKESLVYSEFMIISNIYIHIMYIQYMLYPRHTVKFSDDDWDLQSPPKRIVFKIHWILKDIYIYICYTCIYPGIPPPRSMAVEKWRLQKLWIGIVMSWMSLCFYINYLIYAQRISWRPTYPVPAGTIE